MASPDLMALVYADGQLFVPELPSGKPRCRGKAKSRGGAQCDKPTVPGATVCYTHGGAAPQVRRKAVLRLAEAVDPAIGVLIREMMRADRSADRQRAANSILDRAGIPRTTETITTDHARELLAEQIIAARDAQQTDDEE